MDVTRSNFSQVLKELEKIVSECSFLAIDGEFTGLIDGGPDAAAFDSHTEYYTKLRNGSMNFLFIQFGLCVFKYDKEKAKWFHSAFNFYTFPRPFSRQADDARFLCQSSSLDFLASNGFDFNKLFGEGISYLSEPEERAARARLADRQARSPPTPGRDSAPIAVPTEQAAFVVDACARLDAFLSSPSAERELVLPRSSSFQRKLVYQEARQRFADSLRLETRGETIVAQRLGSEQEMQKFEEERKQKEVAEIDDAVGFSKVIRLLSASGKLVVGHNMMLDAMHVLDQFCAPLPQDYAEFKAMLHDTFPRLLDTKFMASSAAFKESVRSTQLSELRLRLAEEPFGLPDVECEEPGRGYPALAGKYHEAGYDALVTGVCAIAMATHLDPKGLHPDISTLPRLDKYINKLILFRMQDFGFMDLVGSDPVLPRDHVFLVTFPKEWKQMDIVKLFQPISSVFVSWVNDTSAFVALHDRGLANSVSSRIPRSPTYRVTRWAERHAPLAAALPAASVPLAGSPAARIPLAGSVDAAVPLAGRRKRRAMEALAAMEKCGKTDAASSPARPRASETAAPKRRPPVGGRPSKVAAFEESDVWD